MQNLFLTGLLATCALALPTLAQAPLDGFGITNVAHPGVSNWITLSSGELVTFDGQHVELYDASGALISTLTSFPGSSFTGCFAVDPTETFAVVGESSNGDVFRVDLATGTTTFLANVFFNFDAAFAPDGTVYISAATGGFGFGNDLVRLDPLTGATTKVANFDGASGPLAVDGLGNIFYATASADWPTPPASSDIVIFPASVLATANCDVPAACLDLDDAITFAFGFDGATSLERDSATGNLYLAENNFASGLSRIWHVQAGSAANAVPLVDEPTGNWSGGLQLLPGNGPATFQAYQPETGPRLVYNTSGGTGVFRRSVRPDRAELTLAGPGALGAGNVDVTLTGGVPSGFALLFHGPTAGLGGAEFALPLPSPAPLISAMDLGTLKFGRLLALDPTGSAQTSFTNPGLLGVVSIQGVLVDMTGNQLVATTSRVDL